MCDQIERWSQARSLALLSGRAKRQLRMSSLAARHSLVFGSRHHVKDVGGRSGEVPDPFPEDLVSVTTSGSARPVSSDAGWREQVPCNRDPFRGEAHPSACARKSTRGRVWLLGTAPGRVGSMSSRTPAPACLG